MTIERIIELLEIEKECILRNATGECNRYCAKCDLAQDDTELHEMYTEAIAILKELAPRLMTFEEAVCAEVMYYEQRYIHHGITKGHSVFPVIRCVDVFSRRVEWYSPYFPEGRTSLLFTPDEYGILGRCWTSRPTDEQRKAAGWAHGA